ncbi:MAG TPA: imidazoleglycerol-phosphate dehydratase HisB [Bacillota bacterium]
MGRRTAESYRKTTETEVRVRIDLDGTGRHAVDTGVGFFDHMLAQVARHGLVDLAVEARGDLHVDAHHTVEDVGIVLGQALNKALGDGRGIRRYGHAAVPMDEALGVCTLDISGRPLLVYRVDLPREQVGGFDTQLVEVFFQAVATHAGITLHLGAPYGSNAHHLIEALFKSFGRALAAAVQIDPRVQDIPSSKGTLLGGGQDVQAGSDGRDGPEGRRA